MINLGFFLRFFVNRAPGYFLSCSVIIYGESVYISLPNVRTAYGEHFFSSMFRGFACTSKIVTLWFRSNQGISLGDCLATFCWCVGVVGCIMVVEL